MSDNIPQYGPDGSGRPDPEWSVRPDGAKWTAAFTPPGKSEMTKTFGAKVEAEQWLKSQIDRYPAEPDAG